MAKKRNKPIQHLSTQNNYIAIDVGAPTLKSDFKGLTSQEQFQFLDAITQIQQMTWQQLWDTSTKNPKNKRGFNFEKIPNQITPGGKQVFSIRITQKFRARVCRERRYMRFISLHPDHDSTYK